MTTLILGGSGQLGTEFRRLLPNAVAPSRAVFDLGIWRASDPPSHSSLPIGSSIALHTSLSTQQKRM